MVHVLGKGTPARAHSRVDGIQGMCLLPRLRPLRWSKEMESWDNHLALGHRVLRRKIELPSNSSHENNRGQGTRLALRTQVQHFLYTAPPSRTDSEGRLPKGRLNKGFSNPISNKLKMTSCLTRGKGRCRAVSGHLWGARTLVKKGCCQRPCRAAAGPRVSSRTGHELP